VAKTRHAKFYRRKRSGDGAIYGLEMGIAVHGEAA
jgi:hypothetical protein